MGKFIFGFVSGLCTMAACRHAYNKGRNDQLKEIKDNFKNMKIEKNIYKIFNKESET